ncbi:hypothetical protein [Sphingomonas kyeonggiensis]|uniref:Uncharacterized protein n=1 Tax=Sphingomonas kyeonggiensis TaxID=1268553 RepID=A0A7W6JUK6_9SPHN|nr:hypothetical protein [Sphingomonas kyeonggiensis]MBB4098791.1 hypothetical protein [Sphingomonas kyeonggiensis]
MPNPRIAIALLALATIISGSAAWSTADARIAHATAMAHGHR